MPPWIDAIRGAKQLPRAKTRLAFAKKVQPQRYLDILFQKLDIKI